MDISLTPHLEALVKEKVASGMYNSSSEVVQDALRLLEDRGNFKQIKFKALQKEIQAGIQQADRGELIDADIVHKKLREKLKKRQL